VVVGTEHPVLIFKGTTVVGMRKDADVKQHRGA
jgi:hypothetical protein